MAANDPAITASQIIADVESRLGNTNISAVSYLPWISYAYQKTYAALANIGQEVREALFGTGTSIPLTNNITEYSISTYLPRFSSVIKIEVQYGAATDLRNTAIKLKSITRIDNMGQISTTYYSKTTPRYYLLDNVIGFIPTPDGGTAYVWYVKRAYQLTDVTDTLDLDYRFLYPIVNYVQAKALQAVNEDYNASSLIENLFRAELEEVAIAAASEYNEEEGDSVEDSSTALSDNPFSY